MELKEKLKTLPDKPGVYMMKDASGSIIYVGKAIILKNRVRSYFQKRGQQESAKTRVLVSQITDLDWVITDSELEALILESNLIKKYRPPYNICMRDDKHYPYLCITLSEDFPRAILTRRMRKDKNRYFGPYPSSTAIKQTLDVIRRVFKLRPCNLTLKPGVTQKPCLNYHMGHCSGPCAGLITQEEYAESVQQAILFLEGRQTHLIRELEKEMMLAAEAENYEKAARLRDQIRSINLILEKQRVFSTTMADQDVIALISEEEDACAQLFFIRNGKLMGQEHFILEGTTEEELPEATSQFIMRYYLDAPYFPKEILLPREIDEMKIIESWLSDRKGQKVEILVPQRGQKKHIVQMAIDNAQEALKRFRVERKLQEEKSEEELLELQKALHLAKIPYRIEAYDISNTQGIESVGSMVVFESGRSKKSDYRRFKIKGMEEKPNDFAMMRQVLSRRFNRLTETRTEFGSTPDLLLIDGGKGQLGAVLNVMREMDVQIPIMGLAKKHEEIYLPGREHPILLPPDSGALHLLQRIRDEAHRFAITYHRGLRSKRALSSIFDDIDGIGERRRQTLMQHFGSLEAIRNASVEELAEAPTMNRKVASRVYEYLRR